MRILTADYCQERNTMLISLVRALIIYILVAAVMRLMGKRQIGEMEPFELVITLIIADLATIPMAEPTIPLWYGVVPLLILAIIHFFLTLTTCLSPLMRDIISGKPAIVIDPSGIDFKELRRLNISCEELTEQLRNLDFFDMTDINYAIIERSGKITIIPKSASMPTTRKDMQLVKPETDMFYCVIEKGRPLSKNFKEMGLHQDVVLRDIEHQMLCKSRDIAFASLSEGGDVYVQKKGAKAQNFQIRMTEKHFTQATIVQKRKLGEAISKA